MSYILKIDDREIKKDDKDQRNKIPLMLFDMIEHKVQIEFRVERLTTGDYAVYYQTIILFVIERKTWDDFAESIKDGRCTEQIDGMIDLKKKTSCIILYFVEGKLCTEHKNITSKQLLSKADSIMVNYGIPVIYTKDMEETVSKIYQLIELYHLDERLPQLIEQQNIEGDIIIDHCTKPKERTTESQTLECLRAITGVGEIISKLLLKNWTIMELLFETPDEKTLANITYPDGNKLGPNRAKTLRKNLKKSDTHVKILSSVNGVTKSSAKLIVKLDYFTKEAIADITKIGKDGKASKKKIGNAVANRIIEIFSFKYQI